MTDRFIEFFPTQNICFISDDALVGIENAELTLYGEQYTQISTEKESVTFDREIIVQEKSDRNLVESSVVRKFRTTAAGEKPILFL